MRYVAYGLQLSSPFALPGMSEREDTALPAVELEIVTRAAIERGGAPARSSAIWEGTLGEGRTLLLHRTEDGGHLFTYADRALFALDAAGGRLACAPCEEGIGWQRILLSKVLAIVSLIRGYEGLHASAVRSPQGAVLILAPSGTGKTALALALALEGWPLLSDDIVTLGPGPDGVLAHPATPHLNADVNSLNAPSTRRLAVLLGVLGDELWLAARAGAVEPSPVRAICLLERAPFLALDVQRMPANPLALAPFMLGLPGAGAGERSRFELYSRMMDGAALLRVTAGRQDRPAASAELLRGALTATRGEPAAAGR